MKVPTFFLTVFVILSSCVLLSAQNATVKGTITDKQTNEPLIGATLVAEGTPYGAVADLEGNFVLTLPAGTYNLAATYVSYQKESVSNVTLIAGEAVTMSFALGTEQVQLATVEVTAQAKRNSIANVLVLQQKSFSMVSGISQDEIKRSPDRNVGDAVKRVSGASVQDNKFVVIRGLSDRYNTALINGSTLPSTEPDRRAFSFDIFPSNLLDNLVIYKTATPDMPSDFAGGIIQLNTKEIPEEGFVTASVGTGINTQTTFRPYRFSPSSSTDWLGFDNSQRIMPKNLDMAALQDDPYTTSKLFANDWKIGQANSFAPNQSYQLTGGSKFGKLGIVGALTYNNNNRTLIHERADYNVDTYRRFLYHDTTYRRSVSAGALLNMGYAINPFHKLQLNTVYTRNADDQTTVRQGEQFEETRYIRSYGIFYKSTALLTTQLLGDHAFANGKVKLRWASAYHNIDRQVPSYRRMLYIRNYDSDEYVAYIPVGSPSPNFAGRYYGAQQENFYTNYADLSYNYQLFGFRNQLKVGALYEKKDRQFDASVLGYTIANAAQHNYELDKLPIETIFDPENIGVTGYRLRNATDRSDAYTAGSEATAGYVMADQWLTAKLRLTGGLRVEQYRQHLDSYKVRSSTPVQVDTTFLDYLPSFNFIYTLTEKSNLRLSYSKTVARPNFRELAPFSYYEYEWEASISGNPNLTRTRINNVDVKYEYFPGMNQLLAASVFYKHFENPIELLFFNNQGAGTRVFSFQNAPTAYNMGIELEYRLRLSRLSRLVHWQQWDNFTFFGNLSYIHSDVDVKQIAGALPRQLYGQSPYIVNVGLTYQSPELGMSCTALFNQIGRRIWLVGQDQYLHTYEAPRGVLDIQFTKQLNRWAELRLNAGDLLNQRAVFYQDQNKSGKFDDGDTQIFSSLYGRNFSIALNFKF